MMCVSLGSSSFASSSSSSERYNICIRPLDVTVVSMCAGDHERGIGRLPQPPAGGVHGDAQGAEASKWTSQVADVLLILVAGGDNGAAATECLICDGLLPGRLGDHVFQQQVSALFTANACPAADLTFFSRH